MYKSYFERVEASCSSVIGKMETGNVKALVLNYNQLGMKNNLAVIAEIMACSQGRTNSTVYNIVLQGCGRSVPRGKKCNERGQVSAMQSYIIIYYALP